MLAASFSSVMLGLSVGRKSIDLDRPAPRNTGLVHPVLREIVGGQDAEMNTPAPGWISDMLLAI